MAIYLSILYTEKIMKTSDCYGYTLFQNYTAKELIQKLKAPFDESVFLGIVSSLQNEIKPDQRLYGVGIKRGSPLDNIAATYEFGYVRDKHLKDFFRNNKYLSPAVSTKPHGIYAIEYTGNPSKKELLATVEKYYDGWRFIQDLFWDNDRLIIAVFNRSNPTRWYIAETWENSKLDFRFISSTDFSNRVF